MNKITALLTTSLVLCFAGVHADQNVQVGERPFPHAEWVAIQELRAQKATEENAETIKLEQLIPDGKELPKTKVSLDFLKKETRFGGSVWTDFYTTHSGAFQSPVAISFLGDQVTLLDGSIWNVYSADRYKVLYWLTTDSVVIVPNDAWISSYMFKMINQNTGDAIEVNMALGPIAYGLFTYWITTIDPMLGYVWLNDGSYWRTSAFDSSIVKKWLPGDTIVIGVNNDFLHLTNPNILINVNTLTFATSECLN